MTYLNAQQHAKLLEPINPGRVGKDGKQFSHVEAYEIRAHLNRIFGFGRWSADVREQHVIFETDKDQRWTVAYRTILTLAIYAPDGTLLCTYTEGATGEAKNQPSRGDAHDLALKTSQSQALKRCAANLGDQFGLSLYKKGSTAALVYRTLVAAQGTASQADTSVDSHVEETPAESEQADDPRETTARKVAVVKEVDTALDELRKKILAGPRKNAANPHAFWAQLQLEATRAGLLSAQTADENGEPVTVKALIERRMRNAA